MIDGVLTTTDRSRRAPRASAHARHVGGFYDTDRSFPTDRVCRTRFGSPLVAWPDCMSLLRSVTFARVSTRREARHPTGPRPPSHDRQSDADRRDRVALPLRRPRHGVTSSSRSFLQLRRHDGHAGHRVVRHRMRAARPVDHPRLRREGGRAGRRRARPVARPPLARTADRPTGERLPSGNTCRNDSPPPPASTNCSTSPSRSLQAQAFMAHGSTTSRKPSASPNRCSTNSSTPSVTCTRP